MGDLNYPVRFEVVGREAKGVLLKEDENGMYVEWDSFPGKVFIYEHGCITLWEPEAK